MSSTNTCDICGEPFERGSVLGPRPYTYSVIVGAHNDLFDVCSPACLIVLGQRERDGRRTAGVAARTQQAMLGPLAWLVRKRG